MKKIYITILMFLAIFLNIDSVRADIRTRLEREDRGNFKGACNVVEQGSSNCNYECNISDDDGHYIKFSYIAEVLSDSNMNHSITIISTDGDNKVFGTGGSSTEMFLKNYPVIKQFVLDNKFSCPPIIPTDNVKLEYVSMPLLGGVDIVTNYIYIDIDPSYTPENRPGYEPEKVDTSCGFLGGEDSEIVKFLQRLYKYLKIILPVIIIALSIVDFIKVIGTGKDDDMKKAISKFIKRIIIAIIFILVPLIISIIIDVSGVTEQHSGIDDGLKAMFCIIK